MRRGIAAVAVTGGALSLMGAASPVPAPTVVEAAAVTTLSSDRDPGSDPDDRADELADDLLDVLMLPSVQPVAPAPDLLDASDLVKAVQLVEEEMARIDAERQAAEERARAEAEAAAQRAAELAAAGSPDCGLDESGLGAVRSHVREAAEFLGCMFGEPDIYGVAGRAGTSDHPGGLALDFMVDRATGDRLAECALRNKSSLGITYVIWKQRINHGDGWVAMEDRGGVTANHFDHVHVSFTGSGGGGQLRGC